MRVCLSVVCACESCVCLLFFVSVRSFHDTKQKTECLFTMSVPECLWNVRVCLFDKKILCVCEWVKFCAWLKGFFYVKLVFKLSKMCDFVWMYQTKKTLLTGLCRLRIYYYFARIRVFQMSSTYPPKPVCMILSGLSSTSVCVPVIVSLRTLPYQATVKLYCQCHNHPAHPFIFSFNYTKSLLDYCLYKKGLKKKN
jgi:hypothetical protein